MSFPVSVRDTKYFDECLAQGISPAQGIPEVLENSRILQGIVPHAKPALPTYALNSSELKLLCDAVAYLVRTDIVKQNISFYQKMLPQGARVARLQGEDGSPRLLRDPREITKGFRLRNTPFYDELCNSGAEWFRCFAASIEGTRLTSKLDTEGGCFAAAFPLADVTVFLIDPSELVDYKYRPGEQEAYADRLVKRWREI